MVPFERSAITHENDGWWYSVECKGCQTSTYDYFSKEEAAEKWNARELEIVRCKDCKHRVEYGMCYMISGGTDLVGVGDNFFCAYGKRRVEDQK